MTPSCSGNVLAGLAAGLSCALLATPPATAQTAGSTVTGFRPSAPHRVWYGVDSSGGSPDLYSGMTANTGGSADPRALAAKGASTLTWAYGSQISWNAGAQYYSDRLKVSNRTWQTNSTYNYKYVVPGIAMDELANTVQPDVWNWMETGLHDGKQQNPDAYVAAWTSNTVRPQVFSMGRSNTIDLFMVEGYTLTRYQGDGLYWSDAIARLEAFHERGLGHKAVLTLGHITDYPNWKGGSVWTEAVMRQRMEEIKRRFPESPGISFFQASAQDPVEFRRIAQMADRLSQEYWPDNWVPDAVYSLTPQSGTKMRVEANGNTARLWTSRQTDADTDQMQKWRFTNVGNNQFLIEPVDGSGVALEATATGVRVAARNTTAQQKWILTPTTGGFSISPASAPDRFLQTVSTANGAALQLATGANTARQIWAISPEFSDTEYVPTPYHAEAALLAGGTKIGSGQPGSVGGYVSQATLGGTITFNNVDGGDGGLTDLVFRYANGDTSDRVENITINGQTLSIAFPPTGGWGTWENFTFSTLLDSGLGNRIVLTTTGHGGPGLDKMTVVFVPEPTTLLGGATVLFTLLRRHRRRPAR